MNKYSVTGQARKRPNFLESTIMISLDLCYPCSCERGLLITSAENITINHRLGRDTHTRLHMLAGKILMVTKNTNRFGLTRLLLLCFSCCPGYKQTETVGWLVCSKKAERLRLCCGQSQNLKSCRVLREKYVITFLHDLMRDIGIRISKN